MQEVAQKALAQTGMQAEVQMADFARQLPGAYLGHAHGRQQAHGCVQM